MILVSGLQSLMKEGLDPRNSLIVSLALGLGVGIGEVPSVLAQLPAWVTQIFASNITVMVFIITTVLNLLLPKSKQNEKEEIFSEETHEVKKVKEVKEDMNLKTI